jgi:hypothetical protein
MTHPIIFISYSHQDEAWKDRLVKQLKVLELEDILQIWEDRRIQTGDDWQPEIEQSLNSASLAVLLISADFLTSNFIRGQEVPRLLQRRSKEGVRLFPIILLPCPWQRVKWLAPIQVRPKDGKPLASFSEYEIEENLANIALEIDRLLQSAALAPNNPYSQKETTASLFSLVESFPVDGQRITKEELKNIYLKFNHPVDRETVLYITNYYVQDNNFCQWTVCGWIQFAENDTKLIWHIDDKELLDDNKYGPLEIDYQRFEIHLGRRSTEWRVKDIYGNELPLVAIRVFINSGQPLDNKNQTAPASYNSATLRKLLIAAFSDEDFTTFCYDHFRKVYEKFGRGLTFTEKVQLLLEHCEQNLAFDKLLSLVEAENPTQYQRFKTLL